MSWRDCSLAEQHWEERQSRFQADVDRTTSPAKSVIAAIIAEPTPAAIQQGRPLVISTLQLLTDLASMAREETTPAKRATWSVILPWIDSTLAVMPVCIMDEGLKCLLLCFKLLTSWYFACFRSDWGNLPPLFKHIRRIASSYRHCTGRKDNTNDTWHLQPAEHRTCFEARKSSRDQSDRTVNVFNMLYKETMATVFCFLLTGYLNCFKSSSKNQQHRSESFCHRFLVFVWIIFIRLFFRYHTVFSNVSVTLFTLMPFFFYRRQQPTIWRKHSFNF